MVIMIRWIGRIRKYIIFCFWLNIFKLSFVRDSFHKMLNILRCVKTKALGGPHIHELYIDECQDNQIVNIALILKVFSRVEAIFLAVDIAQCIDQGSSFRIQSNGYSFMIRITIDYLFYHSLPNFIISIKDLRLDLWMRTYSDSSQSQPALHYETEIIWTKC